MRAHQYCVIDGAIVISNLAEVCRDLSIPVEVLSPRRSDSTLGNQLSASAHVVGGLELSVHDEVNLAKTPEVLGKPSYDQIYPSEEPPIFSPILKRLEIDHFNALKNGRDYACAYSSPTASLREKLLWVVSRRSMRDENIRPLSLQVCNRIAMICAELCRTFSIEDYIEIDLYFVRKEPEDRFSLFSREDCMVSNSPNPQDGYTSLIYGIFGGQSLLHDCSAIVIFGLCTASLHANAGRNLDACFQTGLLISELYRLQTYNDFEGTAIGGFSPAQFCALSPHPHFRPIMAYGFGAGGTKGTKFDSAVTPSHNRHTSE